MDDMDFNMEDGDVSVTAFTLRNPLFSFEEVDALLGLIEEHKTVVLDKALNAAACFAKESTWDSISKSFNAKGFQHIRTTDSLKLKWDNLKKSTRKKMRDVINGDFDALTSRVVALLREINSNDKPNESDGQSMDDDDNSSDNPLQNSLDNPNAANNVPLSEYLNFTKLNGDAYGDGEETSEQATFNRSVRLANRDVNFTASECNRLLKCVKAEKKYIFAGEVSSSSWAAKSKAWKRVTAAFNKNRKHERTTKSLRTKFENMKKLAKSMAQSEKNKDINTHEQLPREEYKKEKIELNLSDEDNLDGPASDTEDFLMMTLNDMDGNGNTQNRLHEARLTSDPLSDIFNGGSNGVISNNDYNKDLQELMRLKLELARYKLEMAKECREQRKEAHEALMASIAARRRLTKLESKRASFQLDTLKTVQDCAPTPKSTKRGTSR